MKKSTKMILLETLLKIRTRLEGLIEKGRRNKSDYALCLIASDNIFTYIEYQIFVEYLHEVHKKRTKFYYEDGYSTRCTIDKFHWKVNNYKARLNWLNKHIKINQL